MAFVDLPKVDQNSSEPRYLQAKNILADAIRRGEFPAGSKLPSTSEIGARVNVSLITAHKAIQCLVEEGWLRRERGRGTFVRGDYEASVAARPQVRIVLVLHPGNRLSDFYHGGLMEGIHRAAEESDIVGELIIRRRSALSDLASIEADGILCFHPYHDDFSRLELTAREKAVVVVGGSLDRTPLHCVDSENYKGMRAAVRHLVEMGHERIAIVNGPLNSPNCMHRFQGYVAQMEASGLKVRDEHVYNAEMATTIGPVLDRLGKSMRGRHRPTAVIACGYYLALEVMTLLQQMDLCIPKDVSLVGFDDPKSASLLNPPLTTVRQPLEEMGARAYQHVIRLVDGQEPTPRIALLPTTLIVRESTGPA
ncbi:MAG TPA: GntR family transcriptional regulator [Phycisphaerae bacterium]|mgnify:FL=1|jgi:DNA-binding LacI/PurR family transcriptional regulator|nr:substrate-binding domain-containing protein [Phycisphaerae bacterium]HPU33714.1 GntR family transcriptional regulator [Phycisphaerae bacterium]HQA45482.1 GntR family transcriptional regulator [Phycisphaerae bacterium]HXK85361.1 GntR family transcriptional regulator [Phycisphaerae bacterium]